MKALIRKETKTVQQVVETVEQLHDGDIVLYENEKLWVVTLLNGVFTRFTNLDGTETREWTYENLAKSANNIFILTREEALTALAKMWGLPELWPKDNSEMALRAFKHLNNIGIDSTFLDNGVEEAVKTITALRAKVEQLEHDESLSDESIGLLREYLQTVGIEAPFLDTAVKIAVNTIANLRGALAASQDVRRELDGKITALRMQVEELQAEKTSLTHQVEQLKALNGVGDILNDFREILRRGKITPPTGTSEQTPTPSPPTPPATSPPAPPAPAIRRFKLVNAKWLEEWQKSGKVTVGQRDVGVNCEYFIKENTLWFNHPKEHIYTTKSHCPTRYFLVLVDRGIYVEMTLGRVVYRFGDRDYEQFWTTDAAGDSRWLDRQHEGFEDSRSQHDEQYIISMGFTKVIG